MGVMQRPENNHPSSPAAGDELVLRARTDPTALGELFDRYYPAVTRYCARRMPDRSAAEDVTSETFLQMASCFDDFAGRTESEFRSWLFRIAANATAAYLRQSHRRMKLLQTAADRGWFDRPEAAHPSAAEHDRLDWPKVREAIGELDERDQNIVTLRFFADCSHDEIARAIGATTGAVRTALSRAVARLKAKLERYQAPE
jgi:RNA polymerase sigma factor (sigma-70 family)